MAGADARSLLQRAQAEHAAGRLHEALAAARESVAADPSYADAWSYLGTTLITRFLAFEEGLAALEKAAALGPDDPGVLYSLGWCYEFVAYRLEKAGRRPYRDPLELYQLAADTLQRCIDLDPEAGLRDDAEKLRDTIVDRLE